MARPTKEGLYKKSDSPFWYCRFYDAMGELQRVSTGTQDDRLAFEFYNARRVEANRLPDTAYISVNTVLSVYHQERGHQLRGQHGYQQGKVALLKFYHTVDWKYLGVKGHGKSINEYIKFRLAQQVKTSTINREIGILSAAANVAIETGLKIDNPCKGKKQPVTRVQYYWLTHEQASTLLEAAVPRNGFRSSPHLHDYLVIAFGTGMRTSEILRLERSAISFRHNTIRLLTSKSGEPHEIPMSEPVREAVQRCVNRANKVESRYLFVNPQTGKPILSIAIPFKRACKRAGIPVTNQKLGEMGFRVHDTRHTVASWLVAAGETLESVQDLLNHADIRTTQRYAHHAPEARKGLVSRLPKL